MEQLAVTEKRGANYILFELTGSCNSYTVGDLQDKIFDEIKRTNVVLDLSQVFTIDSTAMGMLFAAFFIFLLIFAKIDSFSFFTSFSLHVSTSLENEVKFCLNLYNEALYRFLEREQ